MSTSDGSISIIRPDITDVRLNFFAFWRNADGTLIFQCDVSFLAADGSVIRGETYRYEGSDATDFATTCLQATPVRKILTTLKAKVAELNQLTVA